METSEHFADRAVRLIRRFLVSLGCIVIALGIMSWILDGFSTDGFRGLIVAAVLISLALSTLLPFAYRAIGRLPAIVFPILVFAAAGGIVLLAAWLDEALRIDAFTMDDLGTAIWVTLGVTAIVTILGSIFSLDDVQGYDRFVTTPLRAKIGTVPRRDEPAFLFLEIDGLAGPILQEAMAQGYAPNMKQWIDSGAYQLTVWEPDLSCQTGASQAGILLGNNEEIPAFRWWDKRLQKIMVVSSMDAAKELEANLSRGTGLLQIDGASRFNVFTGGASDSIGTFSKLARGAGSASYWAYFLNPFCFARLVTLFVQEVVREWWEEFQQGVQKVEPRLNRPWKYAFIRAGTTAAQIEVARFMAISDLFRGKPSAYYTLFAYDEVAHHTGIDRRYTFKVLKNMDRVFGHLKELARQAPRPVHLVVLSDHGQSMGATFLQRYGLTLGDLVNSLIPDEERVHAILETDEAEGHFNVSLTEATHGDSNAARISARLLKDRMTDGRVMLGTEKDEHTLTKDEIVVLASGNLGLISFTRWPERMSLAQVKDAFPELVAGLAGHPGIGFIMVQDEVEGGLVIGKEGVYSLESDTFEGVNPLEPYGPLAPQLLSRTNGFDTCPDILCISTFWPETGEVAAFEELIGNHGGLGGTQRNPFVLHPKELSLGDDLIVGCAALNTALRAWIENAQAPHEAVPDSPEEVVLTGTHE
ncbi:MAG TPA: phage holin family protein [Thermomicrobiales bacterium]|nr:phage holin family protein [Thermomicrobiales bacterium]